MTKPKEPTGETRLAVLAELLTDLPEADRRELIADLSPADRVAIARRLIGSGEQTANTSEGEPISDCATSFATRADSVSCN